jgi:hypothetical protein
MPDIGSYLLHSLVLRLLHFALTAASTNMLEPIKSPDAPKPAPSGPLQANKKKKKAPLSRRPGLLTEPEEAYVSALQHLSNEQLASADVWDDVELEDDGLPFESALLKEILYWPPASVKNLVTDFILLSWMESGKKLRGFA